MKKLLLFLSLLATTANARNLIGPPRERSVEVDPARLIQIVGVVDWRASIAAARVKALAETKEPIYIYINSPGGSVMPGAELMNAIKETQDSGIPVVCVSSGTAYSMAFYLLSTCKIRYVLSKSKLMWHPVTTYFFRPVPGEVLLNEGMELSMVEGWLNSILLEALKIEPDLFAYHRLMETIWSVELLNTIAPEFVQIVDSIDGMGPLPTYRD